MVQAQKMKGGAALGIYTWKAKSFQIPHRRNREEGQGEGVCRKLKRVWKRNKKVARAMTVGVLQCRRITDVQKNAGLGDEYHKRGGKQKTQSRAQICVIIRQSSEKRPASRPNI